jgi:hypothetical protein
VTCESDLLPDFVTLTALAALWSVGVGGNLPVDSSIFLGMHILPIRFNSFVSPTLLMTAQSSSQHLINTSSRFYRSGEPSQLIRKGK